MNKTLHDIQREVHAWISQRTPAYWTPHEIYARLGSEVGELAKEINHTFGPLKKKPDEKPSSISEECGDILFTVICLLNSQNLSLEDAFERAMAKCYGRDKDRFAVIPAPESVERIRAQWPNDLALLEELKRALVKMGADFETHAGKAVRYKEDASPCTNQIPVGTLGAIVYTMPGSYAEVTVKWERDRTGPGGVVYMHRWEELEILAAVP